jgi:hypothetical protein
MLIGLVVLAGCDGRPELVRPNSSDGRATVWFQPTLTTRQGLQAIVNEYQVSDIHRVEIQPYLTNEQFEDQPLSKVTGAPTEADDPEVLKIAMSGEDLDLNRAIALSGLRRGQRYRIVANAYTLAGELISNPVFSRIMIQVGDDDRPIAPTTIPLRLNPVSFYGSMPLEVALSDPDGQVDHLEVTVSRMWGDFPSSQGAPVLLKPEDLPHVVTLSNLSAYATYQLQLKARPASPDGPDLAVETLTWTMENDDTLATRSVTITVP